MVKVYTMITKYMICSNIKRHFYFVSPTLKQNEEIRNYVFINDHHSTPYPSEKKYYNF